MLLYDALLRCFTLHGYKIPANTKNIDSHTLLVYLAKATYNPKELGYSIGGFAKFIKKVFPDRPSNKSINTWLLAKENLKYCASCKQVKTYNDFHLSNIRDDKVGSQCKSCAYSATKIYSTFYSSKRRAIKKLAMPAWVDPLQIQEIYKKCPTGYHVDHIIPLQGKNVCGLHVPWNLQYLSIKDNLIKHNKHDSDSNFA